MMITYFCPLWGSEELPFEAFCDQVLAAGYDGVELSFELGNEEERAHKLDVMSRKGLPHIGQHWQTIDADIDEHIETYTKHLYWLAETKPLYINSQTGRDWFTFEDNQKVLEVAKVVTEETGVKIVHETHRGKFSFAAEVTKHFLESYPELRITLDASHWCNVSESLLEDQQEAVELAIHRTDHIHARVGFQEGPQVSDPRAPEFKDALDAHLNWWDQVVDLKRSADENLVICPEFGPYNYMPALPYTMEPLSSQWDLNVHMMNMLRERYS